MTPYESAKDIFSRPVAKGMGQRLLERNQEGQGTWIRSWGLLRYCADFGMTREQLMENFDDAFSAAREMPVEWLEENNLVRITVKEFSGHPKYPEVLESEKERAWATVGTPGFRMPGCKVPE